MVFHWPGQRPPWKTHTSPTSAALEWMRCGGGVPTVLQWFHISALGAFRRAAHIWPRRRLSDAMWRYTIKPCDTQGCLGLVRVSDQPYNPTYVPCP